MLCNVAVQCAYIARLAIRTIHWLVDSVFLSPSHSPLIDFFILHTLFHTDPTRSLILTKNNNCSLQKLLSLSLCLARSLFCAAFRSTIVLFIIIKRIGFRDSCLLMCMIRFDIQTLKRTTPTTMVWWQSTSKPKEKKRKMEQQQKKHEVDTMGKIAVKFSLF